MLQIFSRFEYFSHCWWQWDCVYLECSRINAQSVSFSAGFLASHTVGKCVGRQIFGMNFCFLIFRRKKMTQRNFSWDGKCFVAQERQKPELGATRGWLRSFSKYLPIRYAQSFLCKWWNTYIMSVSKNPRSYEDLNLKIFNAKTLKKVDTRFLG